jgi:hypothetical protein
MAGVKFLITENGYVYQRAVQRGRGRLLLGHISELVIEHSQIGQEVRCWWTQYRRRIEESTWKKDR